VEEPLLEQAVAVALGCHLGGDGDDGVDAGVRHAADAGGLLGERGTEAAGGDDGHPAADPLDDAARQLLALVRALSGASRRTPCSRALFAGPPAYMLRNSGVKLLFTGAAPPASHNANLEPLVEGPAISLVPRHTKRRREGYLK
jgi:hypothetical protein